MRDTILKSSATAADTYYPELVISLCAAVGTDTTAVYDALASELRSVGYTPVLVRLSELMTQLPGLEYLLNLHDEDRRISESQRAGNEIRRILKHGDAVVRLALSALHSKRVSLNDSQDATVPAKGTVLLLAVSSEMKNLVSGTNTNQAVNHHEPQINVDRQVIKAQRAS